MLDFGETGDEVEGVGADEGYEEEGSSGSRILQPTSTPDTSADFLTQEISGEVSGVFSPPMRRTRRGEEEIGRLACWSLSSAKPGFGAENLRDGNEKTFWQSDSDVPHFITMNFRRRTTVTTIEMLVDVVEDDSYCPIRASVLAGSTASDLTEVCSIALDQPKGWVSLQLSDGIGSIGVTAFTFRLLIHENYNGGKDTHVRQVLVFGPKKEDRSHVRPKEAEYAMYSEFR